MSDIFCVSLHMFFSYFLFPYIASAVPLVFHSCPRGSYVMPIEDCFHFSVAKLHINLYDPMDCSTPGFPVLHYLKEFAQTHVHWVSDAIQPSHPLLPPSSSCLRSFSASVSFSISWLFASGGQSTGVSASALPINIQGWLPLGWLVWSPCCPRGP